jgi:hypothetical protein
MPRRCCGCTKVAARKLSTTVAVAFGMKNELARYGKAAPQVRQPTKHTLNFGKKIVARCGKF